jgi:hypothetical protein
LRESGPAKRHQATSNEVKIEDKEKELNRAKDEITKFTQHLKRFQENSESGLLAGRAQSFTADCQRRIQKAQQARDQILDSMQK